jgi:hypothetical protein
MASKGTSTFYDWGCNEYFEQHDSDWNNWKNHSVRQELLQKPIILLDGVRNPTSVTRKIQTGGCHQRWFIRPAP